MRVLLGWVLLSTITFFMFSVAEASQWDGFRGIYVGMSLNDAKAKGFTACGREQSDWKTGVDEVCSYTKTEINSFYGEPIIRLNVGVKDGKVESIKVSTVNRKGNNIRARLKESLGVPKYADAQSIHWANGPKLVDVYLSDKRYEVKFSVDVYNIKKVKPVTSEQSKHIRKQGQIFYRQLMQMRKESDFVRYGFDGYGYSNSWDRYDKWLKGASSLQIKCYQELDKVPSNNRPTSDLSAVCLAINYLNQASKNYARNAGSDNDFTKAVIKDIKSGLNIR